MIAYPFPLKGMKVLIPRGKRQAKSFSELVKGYGGVPVEIPLIAFRPVETSNALIDVSSRLHSFDWLIFTSNVAVETFLSFVDISNQKALPKIAVIGERTESFVNSKGLHAEFIPKEYVAEGFVQEFLPFVEQGMKILIPKGNLARDYICSALSEKGAIVEEVIVYETFFPDESRKLLKEKLAAGELDILTFTSPSTIDHLMSVVKENNLHSSIEHCIIGCIGPISKEKARRYGLTVHAAPQVYTVHNMLKSIIAYIENKYRGET